MFFRSTALFDRCRANVVLGLPLASRNFDEVVFAFERFQVDGESLKTI